MDKLFDIDTYAGCRVQCPDLETLIASGLNGTSLVIRFQKIINHWSVELRVAVANWSDAGPWVLLHSGQEISSDQKVLWNALQFRAWQQVFDEREQLRLRALSALGDSACNSINN